MNTKLEIKEKFNNSMWLTKSWKLDEVKDVHKMMESVQVSRYNRLKDIQIYSQ